jgi:hypothetical protein
MLRFPATQRLTTKIFAVCATAALLSLASANGQVAPGAKANAAGILSAKTQAIALRDAFVSAVAAAGGTCTIPPPAIRVEHVSSYGSYDEGTNTLTTSAWELLTDDERSRFTRLAGSSATPEMARGEFEIGVHRWVFVREMVGWWQTCHPRRNEQPYSFEFGTNRLAAAYWREHDSSVIQHERGVFESILTHVPSPLTDGQDMKAYYDAHYPDKFAGAMDYLWFQAHMCLDAFDEKPAPTFAQLLKDAGSATEHKPE